MEHTSSATSLSIGVGLSANVDAGMAAEQVSEQAAASVKRGEIDLAVHSLKDLPHYQPEGLVVPVTPNRADARDALISKGDLSLEDLPQNAVIGTSSTRRASQLLALRPDFKVIPLRGNVDTRMRKLQEGSPENYDAIILAAAGLDRLDHRSVRTRGRPG